MYAIETYGLTKTFSGFIAVNAMDLKVPAGSIYGFLGPNGAGKTTTLKMLTGLSRPTDGKVSIYGREVQFGSLKNRTDFGFLPDVPNFYDWMRPQEFLMFSGELYGIDQKVLRERAGKLLELVGLQGVKKKIGGFSRGMKQRLGIAQALIHEPKVVFLDEPTSALDPIGRKEVMDIIAQLAGKVTVFLSSHILNDIERVCDRVVILDKGLVMAEGAIDELKQQFGKKGIELETGSGLSREAFRDLFQGLPWAEETELFNENLRIYTSQVETAQMEVPRILSQHSLSIKRFSVLESTLEDVFIKVVHPE